MIPELRLRPIREDDVPFLYCLYAGTRAEEMALLDWPSNEKDAFLRMQFLAQDQYYQTRFGGARFDVIERGDEPIGRLYVDRRADEIRLIDIALVPEHRGRGVGSALVQALLAEAAAAGKPVRIHVERLNPARRLYERLGFVERADDGIYVLMEWPGPRPAAPADGS